MAHVYVAISGGGLCEAFAADVAGILALACMNHHVFLQVPRIGEGLFAHGTLVAPSP